MRNKNRRPLLEIYAEQRIKRWRFMGEMHRKGCHMVETERREMK